VINVAQMMNIANGMHTLLQLEEVAAPPNS